MSGAISPPPESAAFDTCEECGFPIFFQEEDNLRCTDCGKGPLCWDCWETHLPGEESE